MIKKRETKSQMKIHFSSQFYSKIGALRVVIVINTIFVSSSESLTEKKSCRVINKDACIISCRDWNLESQPVDAELKNILKAEGEKFQNCSLILESFTNENTIWDEINPEDNPKVEDLKIFHSPLDLNQLHLKIFQHLRRLTIKNTTIDSLGPVAFRQLPELQKLHIKRPNSIKWVETGFLQNLSLKFLQIQGINLNQSQTAEFFKNLTGGCEIPGIRGLDWSHNNFGNFTKDLLAPFPNLDILILTNSSIFAITGETFLKAAIRSVFINRNKIQKLPEKIFRPLVENASFVSLEGNNLICDCEMKWLQTLIKGWKFSQKVKINCAYPVGAQFLEAEMCSEMKSKKQSATIDCTPIENSAITKDYNFILNSMHTPDDASSKFKLTNNEPEQIEITISKAIDIEGVYLWYGNYANSTAPKFNCLKVLKQKFSIYVTPDANYLICLAKIGTHFHCFPFKTKPSYENQTWLTNKSIPLSIASISVALLFALAMGALILYLSVRKNPSLIRGSKRVIEVKRHDKAQVLIMPRDYDRASQAEPSSLALLNPSLPSRSTLSCDTISTVSYISAHQPTQLEILSYRLSRLRELFQRNNNLPPIVPRMPMQIPIPVNQRLPPDVDLLFEYEWYTITTTTTQV